MEERSAARRILWLTGVGHGSSHAWELIFPAVAIPMARDLSMSFEDVLTLSFALYLLFGLGAPVAGWLTDRFGGRSVLIACLVLGGVSGIAVAFSEGMDSLKLSLGLLGLAASLYHPAGLAHLSRHFEKGIGRVFAINGIAGNVGIAATPFLAGLVASLLGWRWAYFILCAPALVFAAIFVFIGPANVTPKVAGEPKDEPSSSQPFNWRPLVAFAVAVTAGGLAYRLHTLVVPALLQERFPDLAKWTASLGLAGLENLDNLAATLMTSAAYTMGIGGQLLGGRIADTRPVATWYLIFHLACMILIVVCAVASGIPLVVLLFGYLFFAIGMQPLENSLIAKLTPPSWRGRAYAGKFVLAFGIGAMGTYVVGWVSPFGGLGASLITVGALEALLILAILVIILQTRGLRTS